MKIRISKSDVQEAVIAHIAKHYPMLPAFSTKELEEIYDGEYDHREFDGYELSLLRHFPALMEGVKSC